jgi:Mg2+-importing ATPase
MYLAVFQTGWFVESMWSQTMIIHMIRTPKLPFIDSIASKSMIFLTLAGCSIVTALPFTPLAAPLGLKPLPSAYFGFLLLIILGYMFTATVVKKLYIKRYGELL